MLKCTLLCVRLTESRSTLLLRCRPSSFTSYRSAVTSRHISSSASPTTPSPSKREADLLQRVHHLRERALDMERRTTQALEQAGELPRPHTPLAAVAARHLRGEEDKLHEVDEAAQPSPVTDAADWLEEAMEKVRAAEQQLLALLRSRERTGGSSSSLDSATSGEELDELAAEADKLRQELAGGRGAASSEVKQGADDTEVRLGPIPVETGPREPEWMAVPLRSEGEEGEQRAEEQQAAEDSAQEQAQQSAGTIKDEQHIHRRQADDRPAGQPEEETGVSTAIELRTLQPLALQPQPAADSHSYFLLLLDCFGG